MRTKMKTLDMAILISMIPVAFLNFFFTDEPLEDIVKETNLYAFQKFLKIEESDNCPHQESICLAGSRFQ
jgi:hypothetical protein